MGILAENSSISVANLSKNYGYLQSLRGVNLEVGEGEVLGLVGPNGAGKSTFLRILATITAPSEGMVKVMGLDLQRDRRRIKELVGYLAHEPLLYGELTGEENLQFYSKFYPSLEGDHAGGRIDELIALLRVGRWRHELVRNLSSGLRRRFDLARALLHTPRILLLDEPSTGFDIESLAVLHAFIREGRGERTILISTHNVEEARTLCDRVAVLVRGVFVEVMPGPQLDNERLLEIFRRETHG